MRTRVATAAIGAALLLGLAGCTTPQPTDPTPTPAFATEEEAFAAAEETYRAYVDALNAVDLSDPETFEPVYDWTAGDLNSSDRKSYSQWHADGYSKSGSARVLSFAAAHTELTPLEIQALACLDISEVDILDESGASIVSAARPAIQSLLVTFVEAEGTPTRLRISSLAPAQETNAC